MVDTTGAPAGGVPAEMKLLSEAEKRQAKARFIRYTGEHRFIFIDTRKGCVDETVREHLERKAEGSRE